MEVVKVGGFRRRFLEIFDPGVPGPKVGVGVEGGVRVPQLGVHVPHVIAGTFNRLRVLAVAHSSVDILKNIL